MFGKEKNHLKLILADVSGKTTQAIGFFMTAERFPHAEVLIGGRVNVIATMEKSFFRGRPELRLRIVDIN